MAKELTTNGDTSRIERVFIPDSSSTIGAGLTGLTNSSSGLIISTIADSEATATAYTSAASNIETIAALGTYVAPTAGKCRFQEVDSVNHPGLYEIQFEDARYAIADAEKLIYTILGATNLALTYAEIQLAVFDPYATQIIITDILSDGIAINTTGGVVDEVTKVIQSGTGSFIVG